MFSLTSYSSIVLRLKKAFARWGDALLLLYCMSVPVAIAQQNLQAFLLFPAGPVKSSCATNNENQTKKNSYLPVHNGSLHGSVGDVRRGADAVHRRQQRRQLQLRRRWSSGTARRPVAAIKEQARVQTKKADEIQAVLLINILLQN